MSNKPEKAVITFQGTLDQEPSARLEDGRIMPMGWNRGNMFPIGTKGIAQYISTPSMGLWLFTPNNK